MVIPAPNAGVRLLVRYDSYATPANADYFGTSTDTVNAAAGYYVGGLFGYLYLTQHPGTHGVWSCVASPGRHFMSLSPTCDGSTVYAFEGWAYDAPQLTPSTMPVYACWVSTTQQTLQVQVACPNMSSEVLLGYTLTQP